MKNKSILSVWHAMYGSGKRKEKGYMSFALTVTALFSVGSACAKNITAAANAVKSRATVVRQPSSQKAPKGRQIRKQAEEKQLVTTQQGGIPAEKWDKYIRTLIDMLNDSNSSLATIFQAIQKLREHNLTAAQISWLSLFESAALQRQRAEKLQIQWSNNGQWMQQQPQQPSFSVSGAAQGIAGVGTQAVTQATDYLSWMKDKASEWLGGSYVSSMGGAKYIAPAVLGFIAGPVGLAAAAAGLAGGTAVTAALATGGSGLAIWGLSNIMDRANFMALSGGHGTTESWLKALKEQLSFILDNNIAAYPYYVAKIEALRSKGELSPADDETGVVKQAYDELLAQCAAKIEAIKTSSEIEDEKLFSQATTALRASNGYSANGYLSSPDQYMENLRKNNDLIKAQALVSEYNRALNRKNVQSLVANQKNKAEEKILLEKTLLEKTLLEAPKAESTKPGFWERGNDWWYGKESTTPEPTTKESTKPVEFKFGV